MTATQFAWRALGDAACYSAYTGPRARQRPRMTVPTLRPTPALKGYYTRHSGSKQEAQP